MFVFVLLYPERRVAAFSMVSVFDKRDDLVFLLCVRLWRTQVRHFLEGNGNIPTTNTHDKKQNG